MIPQSLEFRMGRLESDMAELKGAYHQIDKRLGELRADLTAFDGRLDRKIDNRFAWVMGVQMSSWVTIMIALVFKH